MSDNDCVVLQVNKTGDVTRCVPCCSPVVSVQFQLTTKVTEAAKKLRTHPRGSVVTVVLVRGTDLLPMDDNGLSDPYVKFRLGNEKYKSKVCLRCWSIQVGSDQIL